MNASDIVTIVTSIKIINLDNSNSINKCTGIQQANPLGMIVKNTIFIALLNITSGYKLEFNNASLTASVKYDDL